MKSALVVYKLQGQRLFHGQVEVLVHPHGNVVSRRFATRIKQRRRRPLALVQDEGEGAGDKIRLIECCYTT